jgi:hypothetical protein
MRLHIRQVGLLSYRVGLGIWSIVGVSSVSGGWDRLERESLQDHGRGWCLRTHKLVIGHEHLEEKRLVGNLVPTKLRRAAFGALSVWRVNRRPTVATFDYHVRLVTRK